MGHVKDILGTCYGNIVGWLGIRKGIDSDMLLLGSSSVRDIVGLSLGLVRNMQGNIRGSLFL